MAVEAALFPPGVSTVVGSAKVCLNHPVQPEGWGSNSKSLATSSALLIFSFSTAYNWTGRGYQLTAAHRVHWHEKK